MLALLLFDLSLLCCLNESFFSPVEEEQSGTTSVTGKVKEASVSLWPAFIYCLISFSFNANDIYGQGVV